MSEPTPVINEENNQAGPSQVPISPDPKRSRQKGEQKERRIAATQVGEDVYHQNDVIWDEEKIEWVLEQRGGAFQQQQKSTSISNS